MSQKRARLWTRVGMAFEKKALGESWRSWQHLAGWGLCNAVSELTGIYEADKLYDKLAEFAPKAKTYLNDKYGPRVFWARNNNSGNMARAMFAYLMAAMEEEGE